LSAAFDVPPEFLEPVAAIRPGKISTHLSCSGFSTLTKTVEDLSIRLDMQLSSSSVENGSPFQIGNSKAKRGAQSSYLKAEAGQCQLD